MDQEVKKVWLENLKKEQDEQKEQYSCLQNLRSYLEECVRVLGRFVESSEKQVAKRHYQETHEILAEEGRKELSSAKNLLSEKKREEEEKGKRLTFLEQLIWYVEKDRDVYNKE